MSFSIFDAEQINPISNDGEPTVADEPVADVNQTATNTAEPVGPEPKIRAPRRTATPKAPKETKTGSKAAKAQALVAGPIARKKKKYTPAERASILASIEKSIRNGKSTLKATLQQAEVSEQTYYNWKNAAAKAAPVATQAPSNDDLSTLVALEAENLKLRKELAAKLRAENAELRKRLGKS